MYRLILNGELWGLFTDKEIALYLFNKIMTSTSFDKKRMKLRLCHYRKQIKCSPKE